MDNRHLQKKITNDQVNADEKRKQAEQLRRNASGLYDESNHDSARKKYLEDEANKQEQLANELDAGVQAAQAQMQQNDAKLKQLEQDRASKIAQHDQEIARIDQEIANLRGASYM